MLVEDINFLCGPACDFTGALGEARRGAGTAREEPGAFGIVVHETGCRTMPAGQHCQRGAQTNVARMNCKVRRPGHPRLKLPDCASGFEKSGAVAPGNRYGNFGQAARVNMRDEPVQREKPLSVHRSGIHAP